MCYFFFVFCKNSALKMRVVSTLLVMVVLCEYVAAWFDYSGKLNNINDHKSSVFV